MEFPGASSKSRRIVALTLEGSEQSAESRLNKRTLLSRLRSFLRHREQGGSLIEFAMVLPLVVVLLTGMVTFGMLLNTFLVLSHATDVGARSLAVSRGQTQNPCADTVTAIQGSGPTLVPSRTSYSFTIGSGSFSGGSTGFSGTGNSSCAVLGTSDMVAGNTVTVSVTYPFQMIMYGWRPTTINMRATTTEVIQ